mmetsp:Transcript_9320/g.22957  ORF Transcript_9320/g.22957 Transcript_9320/m.22957 type:complete len:301 (-) Transcript_9320:264-1166(-)
MDGGETLGCSGSRWILWDTRFLQPPSPLVAMLSLLILLCACSKRDSRLTTAVTVRKKGQKLGSLTFKFGPSHVGIEFNNNTVASIVDGSQAAQKGVRPGWILRRINGNRVSSNVKTGEVVGRLRHLIKNRRNLYLRFDQIQSTDESEEEFEFDKYWGKKSIIPQDMDPYGLGPPQDDKDEIPDDHPLVKMGSELVAPLDPNAKILGYDGPGSNQKFGEVDQIPWNEMEENFSFIKERRKKRKPKALSRHRCNDDSEYGTETDGKGDDKKSRRDSSTRARKNIGKTKKGRSKYNANHFKRT